MRTASLIAFALYGLTVATHGLGADGIVSARPFALFALVVLAWYLPRLAAGADRAAAWTLVSGALVLIVMSLSRTAFAASVALLAAAGLFSHRASPLKKLAMLGVAFAVAGAAFSFVGPLHDRFSRGDVRHLSGGVNVNVEGRFAIWGTVWRSYRTSPVIGHGAGSSDDVTRAHFRGVDHPHNDYLRILHDYGAVGFVLWVAALIGLARRSFSRYRAALIERASSSATFVHQSALLGLLALAIAMVTDNPMVYLYVLGPIGAFVGASIGGRRSAM
jgi:O-antigen ligase